MYFSKPVPEKHIYFLFGLYKKYDITSTDRPTCVNDNKSIQINDK